jgi:protein-arginine kinase activator protein McsA
VTGDQGAGRLCESCRLRPATTTVTLGSAVPFAVCDQCRPVPSTHNADAVLVAPDHT